MHRFLCRAAACLLVFCASAQEQPSDDPELVVVVSKFAPCVMAGSEGKLTGFDVELWQAIADEIGVAYRFKEVQFPELLSAVASGEADVGMAGMTITDEREEAVDFSHHYLDSGLRILVGPSEEGSLLAAVRQVLTPRVLKALFYLFVFIVVCGHIVWYAERGKEAIDDRYFPGVFEAFWWAFVTMTTVGYGDIAPRRWLGRAVAVLVMFTGISFFGWFVAQMSSSITLEKLRSEISGPQDMRGRKVGTKAGTTSVAALKVYGADVVTYPSIEEAYLALMTNDVRAVVFDSPSILNFANGQGEKVAVVGGLFDLQYYGIAFPPDSPLREPVNRALLKLRRSGRYDQIHDRWFGSGQ
jgi:ABC-type amino acid transport substrate-binding protein